MEKNSDKNESIKNSSISGAQYENVQRHGAAVKEHISAYSGKDNEAGTRVKGLKDISESKVNPEYKDNNIKQQAGYSAEVKTVARENAEKAVNGTQSKRTTRTDDMTKQSDGRGHTVGGKNEQLYDIAEVDKNGAYIEGSARQLKYVGGDPKTCTNKLLIKKFDKYRDADVPIEVPSDFYDDVQKELSERSEKLKNNIANAEKRGDTELAQRQREKLDKIEKTKNSLRKGKLTNKEAIEARVHPALSTAKDIHKLSHRAGVEGAKIGAAVGGGISAIQNTVAVIKGDKDVSEALIVVVGDTSKATAFSYATGYIGSALKGAMQNAPSKYLQALSKTNLPAVIVGTALDVGKTLTKFAAGEIDGTQCLEELGEKGSGMLAASMGAAVGQTLIPIPIVGGLVGGMVGYTLSSMYYNSLLSALKNAKIAREKRLRIEAECLESINAIKEYRLQIEIIVNNYLQENQSAFDSAFSEMEIACNTADINKFIKGANKITQQIGGVPLFETKQELDGLMNSNEIIQI